MRIFEGAHLIEQTWWSSFAVATACIFLFHHLHYHYSSSVSSTRTIAKVVYMIKVHINELLTAKFGKMTVNLTQVQNETRLSYTLVQRWFHGDVQRFDAPVLDAWCKYLDCQPGDILTYEEGSD